MKEEKIELLAVNRLLNYKFEVPSYQRGYRWTSQQVKDLLEDIYEFQIDPKIPSDQYYCLQPVVVSKEGDKYILIDGQQRLTTIHIIFTFLEKIMELLGKEKFDISYETRKDSEAFMKSIDLDKKTNNVDYFHICQAYETIKEWFDERDGTVKMDFLNTILREDGQGKNIRVIWYEVGEEASAIDIFTRLNMGKIPLTNAELIKALFLSKHSHFTPPETRKIRQLEISTEWDAMELELQDAKFWLFLNNNETNYTNKIELIFDLIVQDSSLDNYHTFRYFNNEIVNKDIPVEKLWDKVKRIYLTLSEWYEDHTYFHLVGFLLTTGESLITLIDNSMNLDKDEFLIYLKDKIQSIISIADLPSYNYGEDNKNIRTSLLLFNIITMLNLDNASLRFSFDKYKNDTWDIEHIHAIKSEPPIKENHRLDWLREVQKFADESSRLGEDLKSDIKAYFDLSLTERETRFKGLYEKIVEIYSEEGDGEAPNDISNLALLDSGTNRGYSNAVFPIKRNTIINKEKNGKFIPICTKNVFLKYYSDNVEQMTFWGKDERKNYKENFILTLTEYFNK